MNAPALPTALRGEQALAAPGVDGSPQARRSWIVPVAILVVSVVPRLPNFTAPPLERHDFRQTQTAITVQAYLDHGPSVLHYELPVLGPPWQVPFELPTYQLSAYPLARTGLPLDVACRITSLLWFYLSAVLLLVLARRFVGHGAANAALAFYVLSPYSVTWSRAVLIDYASVAMSLGYLLAVAAWSERPRLVPALAAVVLGALAAMTKVTTLAMVAPALALIGVAALRRGWAGGPVAAAGRALALVAFAGLPLAATIAWTRWCDRIKEASPAARVYTSERLRGWLFGSLEQRLTAKDWGDILVRIHYIVPGLFLATFAFAAFAAWRRGGSTRLAVIGSFAGAILPMAAFFNVFRVHDYYLIGTTPALAVAAGIGMAELLSLRFPRRGTVLALLGLVALATAKKPIKYGASAWMDTRKMPVVAIARVVQEATPADGWVVVEGDDWSPRIAYLAHRRAFMIGRASPELVAGRPEVATLVCFTCPAGMLSFWPQREKIAHEGGADIFRITSCAGGGGVGQAAAGTAERAAPLTPSLPVRAYPR